MSFWFFLWILFALLMMGVTGWSTFILFQQKQAWKKFASDKKISFRANKFFAPAEMNGNIEEFVISFFTGEQQNPEARKNRQLTIVEIVDPHPYVDGVAAGNDQMRAFINLLDTLSAQKMDDKNWNKANVISSRHKKSVDAYLTPARIKIINEMISFPKSDVIVLLDGEQGVFRFETSNPLTDAAKIEAMLQKMFARIRKLRPAPEEVKKLQSLEKDKADTTISPTITSSEENDKNEGVVKDKKSDKSSKKEEE